MVDQQKVLALIAKHEGFRATCYRDTRGFLTIGYGFNLDAVGANAHCSAVGLDYDALRGGRSITEAQAYGLMASAAQHASDTALVVIRGFIDMPEPVQLAVVDMIYELGAAGFMGFVELRAALEVGDWAKAAEEMRASKWDHEVHNRAEEDIALVLSALSVKGE